MQPSLTGHAPAARSNQCEFLSRTELFAGATPDEIASMLGCLGAYEKSYRAGERIHHMGEHIDAAGIVLSGQVRIESVDVWGNVSVIGTCPTGGMFGEVYAAVPDEPLMVDVIAVEDTRVLFVLAAKVLSTCSAMCPHHARTSQNMVRIIARKNLAFSRRILHVAPKTMRGKVLAYLSDEAERAGSRSFDIPFNRQQLADYLGVDRSALSAELSRMARDGLIVTHRSHFELPE